VGACRFAVFLFIAPIILALILCYLTDNQNVMTTLNQLQGMLKTTYVIVPIVAGLDKFTNLLTNWSAYLGPSMRSALPIDTLLFMKIVGVIEIIAGLIVWVKPKIGGYIVMAWLICIALELMVATSYYDVAVRDLVMAVGAFTLVQLSAKRENGWSPV
jgi:hypothetical protein